ncbi:MAG: hypothetical protein ABR585_07430 [Gemmatimonadaceae bacterium]
MRALRSLARPACDWCGTAPATELLIRDRPTRQGGTNRAWTLSCAGCGDQIARTIVRSEDLTAMYRLAINPLIPASAEAC